MRIARPPTGFKIHLSESAQSTLSSAQTSVPRLHEIWDGVCERLKFTAHREGQLLPNGQTLSQIDGDPTFGIPKIALIYSVVGDTVTVHRLLIPI